MNESTWLDVAALTAELRKLPVLGSAFASHLRPVQLVLAHDVTSGQRGP